MKVFYLENPVHTSYVGFYGNYYTLRIVSKDVGVHLRIKT